PFEAVHVALYCAFFTDGINIGRPEEDLEVVARVPGVDVGRFLSNFEFGRGRQAVLEDYEAPVSRHAVRVIPTLVVPDGRHVIGAVSLSEYRRVLGGVTALWLRFGQDAADPGDPGRRRHPSRGELCRNPRLAGQSPKLS